jgi:hypothetical protein
MKDASPRPAAAHFECALRVAGRAPSGGYEVSVDGSEYRQCRLENGAWRARWEITEPGEDPIVAVFRPRGGG